MTWQSMLNRCRNPNAVDYARYGGRGILVCERWLDFQLFLQDMGERPEGRSIDRIDPDGNYEKSNCRWATAKEQSANRKNTRWVTIDNIRMTLSDAERKFGVISSTISRRIKRGWTAKEAIFGRLKDD